MTVAQPYGIILWAAGDRLTHLGQRFQPQHDGRQFGHVLVLLLLAAALACAWLVTRYQRRAADNSPRALFAELCRAHRLGWSARRLLAQLARLRHVSNPAELFVEPRYFEADHLNGAMRERLSELHALRDRIFGKSWCQAESGQTPAD